MYYLPSFRVLIMPGYNTVIHYQMISAVDYKTLRTTLGIRGQNVLRELKSKCRRDSEPNNSKPQDSLLIKYKVCRVQSNCAVPHV